ncbi:LLM class flavin-dependent oxidoreductase [Rathayibacter soli]|uniref:LLM class flavin-dependent oxidoreductase n=1 Tax=Rathayibacter soli TaxID=3144168 RepID=UPI0027E453E2|nr:LLM class flavin-dependent oxidoreductase [Glaciibacter superstes]
MAAITIGVQAEPHDLDSWLALARRLERANFHSLVVSDHPGNGASPWPALGAAAAVTETLNLGTYVLQAGVRDPVQAAADAATLDILAPGRVLFGLGAGHTYREWEVTGRQRPSPTDRAARLVYYVDAVARLLSGESVTVESRHLRLVNARLEGLPVGADRVKLVVGGGHREILRVAAERADVVALSGLGRTKPDGHRHEVRWGPADLRGQLEVIREASERRGTAPEIEALIQMVTETDSRSNALAELGKDLTDAAASDLASTPFLLVGTVHEMAAQLTRQAEQFGITRYVVREPAVSIMERVLPLLGIEARS